MKFKKLLILVSAIALIFKIFEKFVVVEEETRFGLRVGLDPNSGKVLVEEEDSADMLLDELETMDEEHQEELIHELVEQLHEGEDEEEEVKAKKVNVRKPKVKNKPVRVKAKKTNSDVKLNGRQSQILELLDNNKKIDTDLLMKNIKGVTVRTFRRDLDKLDKAGLVKKVGKTKGSYYVKS